MSTTPQPLVDVREARARETAALEDLRSARDDLAAALLDASEAGHTYARIGDAVGMSKQRVRELIDRAAREEVRP
jgi:DNA-directed RNA polymerase specialized sigma24 family protein